MTVYLCDGCMRQYPAGAKGSVFLVRPDGQTRHFCSSACIRSHVNGLPISRLPHIERIFFFTGGAVFTALAYLLGQYLSR